MPFRVELESYRGPLDLLVYLVRRHELEATQIRVAHITRQFEALMDAAEQSVNADAVGEFLELATLLMEIKSRLILPQTEEEEQAWEDPHGELVERLLEYKKYKDIASLLEERSRLYQRAYVRLANLHPARELDPAEQPIRELELWDLVSAFGRLAREQRLQHATTVVYDETPIQVYMEQIRSRLSDQGETTISSVFRPGMPKSALIGVFLAVLELTRHHRVNVEQADGNGDIWIRPGSRFQEPLEAWEIDEYSSSMPQASRAAS